VVRSVANASLAPERTQLSLAALVIGKSQNLTFELEDGSQCGCALSSSGSAGNVSLQVTQCVSLQGSVRNSDCTAFVDTYTVADLGGSSRVCGSDGICDTY
jgi:hypothetical protein